MSNKVDTSALWAFVLATICGSFAAIFMFIIGMDYWLALGIWTGLVAQFVPTVGTYIAIALPVVIGLIGDEPWQGIAVLAFALVYQQIENITLDGNKHRAKVVGIDHSALMLRQASRRNDGERPLSPVAVYLQ